MEKGDHLAKLSRLGGMLCKFIESTKIIMCAWKCLERSPSIRLRSEASNYAVNCQSRFELPSEGFLALSP
jgi:hypothetical protein